MTRVLLHKLWISVTRGYSYDQSFTSSVLNELWISVTTGHRYDQISVTQVVDFSNKRL